VPAVTDTCFFKVIARLEDGTVAVCTAVEHQDKVWIVPRWLPPPDESYARPERMTLLEQFRHERTDPPDDTPDLLEARTSGCSIPFPERCSTAC
jgi:hypothetical protein